MRDFSLGNQHNITWELNFWVCLRWVMEVGRASCWVSLWASALALKSFIGYICTLRRDWDKLLSGCGLPPLLSSAESLVKVGRHRGWDCINHDWEGGPRNQTDVCFKIPGPTADWVCDLKWVTSPYVPLFVHLWNGAKRNIFPYRATVRKWS